MVWSRSRCRGSDKRRVSRCRIFDKKRVSLTSIVLSADVFSTSRAQLTRVEVICKARSITSTRLAVMLSGSMLETLRMEML